ncbi:MAG: thiamine-phosphate kinase, partial [Cocleimonas sp.]
SAEWFTLALTLPSGDKPEDKQWLKDFSLGLKTLSQKTACALVGGDTTRGDLSITIQVMGFVNKGKALLRNGAKLGDNIYVTGTLGDASVGLACVFNKLKLSKEDKSYCQQRLNRPTARLVESEIIKRYATSCIDISDGLLQDLSHILTASSVGAEVDRNKIPLSSALQSMESGIAIPFALSGGDDYELLFTIPIENEDKFLRAINYPVTLIGKINNNVQCITDENGNLLESSGYNHFVK